MSIRLDLWDGRIDTSSGTARRAAERVTGVGFHVVRDRRSARSRHFCGSTDEHDQKNDRNYEYGKVAKGCRISKA